MHRAALPRAVHSQRLPHRPPPRGPPPLSALWDGWTKKKKVDSGDGECGVVVERGEDAAEGVTALVRVWRMAPRTLCAPHCARLSQPAWPPCVSVTCG